MKLALRIFISFVLIYAMVMLTACPSAASLQKVQDSSARVAKYANAGVDLTRTLYESKVITLAQKDAIAQKFVLLARGGIAFDAAVANAKATYGTNAPQATIQQLLATFDSQVVGQFLEILTSLKVIGASGAYAAIIETIRAAVMVVAGVFGTKAAVTQRLAAA